MSKRVAATFDEDIAYEMKMEALRHRMTLSAYLIYLFQEAMKAKAGAPQ